VGDSLRKRRRTTILPHGKRIIVLALVFAVTASLALLVATQKMLRLPRKPYFPPGPAEFLTTGVFDEASVSQLLISRIIV
jgi:hypothetical protein